MKKKEFKIGDRVIVTKSQYNGKGTVVHVTKENYLIKFDDIIGTYNYSFLAEYQSDKKDLWWVKFHSIKHIEKSITKKELLKRIEALEVLNGIEKKTDLEVGKWYKCDDWLLLYSEDKNNCSGWFEGSYEYNYWSFDIEIHEVTLATTKKVEGALIKEAKKRGFEYDSYIFDERTNILWGNDNDDDGKGEKVLFNNGKWIENIEVDKFAELKEAHKNGAVIQYFSELCSMWEDVYMNEPLWADDVQYRIKPDDKPKVGDVAKVWNDDENIFVISTIKDVKDFTSYQYPYKIIDGSVYMNAKKLTEEDVIKLLFKYERI